MLYIFLHFHSDPIHFKFAFSDIHVTKTHFQSRLCHPEAVSKNLLNGTITILMT